MADGIGTSEQGFWYGVVTAVIGAVATQLGVWITAKKRQESESKNQDLMASRDREQRQDHSKDALIDRYKTSLAECEEERDQWRTRWNDMETRNIKMQKDLARARFYGGVLRGLLISNHLENVIPKMSIYDLNDEKDPEQ